MRIPKSIKTPPSAQETTVIFVYSDKSGITDNIRGLVGVYKICKLLGLRFKVNIVSPFKLTDFLLPNKYDWEITPQEFNDAVEENNICGFSCLDYSPQEVLNQIKKKCENRRYLTVKSSVMAVNGYEYGQLYDELFLQTAELREAIDLHLRQIGGDFVSATFRFQQLLGDFVEGNYPILKSEEREILTARCLEHLEEIHKENPEKKILLTSDSYSFLAASQKLNYVYAVLEKIVHPRDSKAKTADKKTWMKSFLDYFLLTRSQKIYSITDGLMYGSSFPMFAAMHGKTPFVAKDYRFMYDDKKNSVKTPIFPATAVFVFDDRFGIIENITGLVSVYKICKLLGLRFKINADYPFKLTDFLLPNKYDWEITPQEFAAAVEENNFCEIFDSDNISQEILLNRIKAKFENHKYLTVKSNCLTVRGYEYGQLYDELFLPTAELREAIDLRLREIGGGFISATFRFKNLLGDFVEGNYSALKSEEREILTARCLEHLEEIHKENPEKKILLTSDSYSFLAAAQKFDYVYALLEEIVYPVICEAKYADKKICMKSFLVYFLLTRSQKVYSVADGFMYDSDFPRFAAMRGKTLFVVKIYSFTYKCGSCV